MDWYIIITLFFLLLMITIFLGFPVFFAFLTVNMTVGIIFIGLNSGVPTLVHSSFDQLSALSLTPVPLFIFMGTILFHSGLVMRLVDSISVLLGKLPARLSLLSVGAGTLLSAMSGSAVADAAMLSSTLAPEMQKRGYHLKMIVGPILIGGTLAVIIPPSTLAILLASTARISVGDILIAGIIPGILIALITVVYYVAMGYIYPDLAPMGDYHKTSTKEKLQAIFLNIIPISSLIILVLGLIFSGNVTPTESAAVGVVGALLLSVIYKSFTFEVIKTACIETIKVGSMILAIIATSAGFSQILSYTGATRGLIDFIISWNVAPIFAIIVMLIIIVILGTFIEPISIMMLTVPLYFPIINELNVDPIWFGILMLICLALGNITPPFGLLLFVVKGALPSRTSIKDIYVSVISIVVIILVSIVIIMIIPSLVTWLPNI